MQFLLLSAGITLSLCVSAAYGCQDKLEQGSSTINSALRRELLERAEKDQSIRTELIKEDISKPNPTLLDRMKTIDHANTKRLIAIVKEHGWPGVKLVGTDGANAAFLIVQHADHSVQKEMLPLVERAFKEGDFSSQNYALLLDRVLVGEGKPQVFGTQAEPFDQWINQEPKLAPISDEKNVDERRRQMGLPTIEEYRKLLKKVYFPNR